MLSPPLLGVSAGHCSLCPLVSLNHTQPRKRASFCDYRFHEILAWAGAKACYSWRAQASLNLCSTKMVQEFMNWWGETRSNVSHFRLLVSGVTSCLICAPKNLITTLFWGIQMTCRVSGTSFFVCFPYAWGLCSIKTEIAYPELRLYPLCVPVQHCSCHTINAQSLIL